MVILKRESFHGTLGGGPPSYSDLKKPSTSAVPLQRPLVARYKTSMPTFSQSSQAPNQPIKCPALTSEFQHILNDHKVLASTGCTRDFCQAGRSAHTDEPRVGENRALSRVEEEATEFLREFDREGGFKSAQGFKSRLRVVLAEIRDGTVEGIVREDKRRALVGGNWHQTVDELNFGIRRAWRNSRKCIGRPHCEELQLCDLRATTSSAEMATELVRAVAQAYNDGRILPTVFLFPPRRPNSRGPMLWNHQILEFAAYELEDGTILGDPRSVEITKAIIDLGWKPPQKRSRWDFLPLVTMAEDDLPFILEIPPSVAKLVEIRHPQYEQEFQQLDLKWKAYPALTFLGFDIGGVQYTAAPFIGWFIDAEIGVRDLADSFRYNVLPDVIQALNMMDGKLQHSAECFEDLPEYERLALLSKAQTELNLAVHYSFLQAKVILTDSLTASEKWCKYDDSFREKNGYRLPADPYWLAPPQGSIIPLWHRGGAPNYQPKPMITKHVQDPIKAWKREQHKWDRELKTLKVATLVEEDNVSAVNTASQRLEEAKHQDNEPRHQLSLTPEIDLAVKVFEQPDVRSEENEEVSNKLSRKAQAQLDLRGEKFIAVYFCSAGIIAEKLARKVHGRLEELLKASPGVNLCSHVEALNHLSASKLTPNTFLLVIVSSTGQGDVPPNGSKFMELDLSENEVQPFDYAIFGSGNSCYSSTYNAAATKVNGKMKVLGGEGKVYRGDTAVESLPLSALNTWWISLKKRIGHFAFPHTRPEPQGNPDGTGPNISRSIDYIDEIMERYESHETELGSFRDATVSKVTPQKLDRAQRSLYVSLDIGEEMYEDMNCVQILPLNCPLKVHRALDALSLQDASATTGFGSDVSFTLFLSEFVDLERPFLELKWLSNSEAEAGVLPVIDLACVLLRELAVLDALEFLRKTKFLPVSAEKVREICLDMPLLHSRTYSLASSLRYLENTAAREKLIQADPVNRKVDIMVKVIEGGRFSDVFLRDSAIPASLKVRIVDSFNGPRLRQLLPGPLVLVATGAGFGPVRCLLQQRIAIARDAIAAGESLPSASPSLSIFIGLHPSDIELTSEVLCEAKALNLTEMMSVVPSNEQKFRVYDKLAEEDVAQHVRTKLLKEQGSVFVCTSFAAAQATRSVFERILGGTIADVLGERYIEEVF